MNMKKTLFLVLMIVALLCFSGAAMAQSFFDMPNNWSTEALQHAVDNGLLFGSDGYLKPNDSLKRSELAAIVVRAFGANVAADISHFSDVNANAWYAVEMAKAVEMKVMEGDGIRLNPETAVTREQAFAVLARAFHIANGSKADFAGFLDASSVSSWFEAELGGMVKAGYVSGSDQNLEPLSPITRAEFAQVMHTLVQTYVVAPGTYTADYAGNVLVRVSDARFEGVTFNGNLIAADGIGTGNIYLKDCTVKGEVIIRGGGMNSVVIDGGNYPNGITVVTTPSGGTRIFTTDASGLEVTIAETAANETVKIEGSIAKVTVNAENVNLEIADNSVVAALVVNSNNTTVTSIGNGTITDVQVNVPAQSNPADAVITLNANMTNVTVNTQTDVMMDSATVTTLTVAPSAASTSIHVGAEATVTTMTVNAQQTTVTASNGAVMTTVNVSANNVTVAVPSTMVSVIVGSSVTGSVVNETAVAANTTTTVTSAGVITTTPTTPPVVVPPESEPEVVVSAISVTPTIMTLTSGGATGTITATVSPVNATNRNIIWSSSNRNVATVANGIVTPIAVGTTTITATSASDGTKTAATEVTVNPIARINSINPATLREAFIPNNGSLISGNVVITIANGIFADPLVKADVTASAGLPIGMDYTVTRNSDTQLTITITGSAANHADANDVSNLSFTIAKAKIAGAIANLTTEDINIDFNDPVSISATTLNYAAPSGFSGASNTVALTGTTFTAAAIAENTANWTIDTGTTNLQVFSITRTGDQAVTINFTVKTAGLGSGTGTITIQAKAAALTSNAASNIASVVITDNSAPIVSNCNISAITDSAATLSFSSNESGTYYYLVYVAADAAPDAAIIKAQGSSAARETGIASAAVNTSNITSLERFKAYKAYVIVEDSTGNISDLQSIEFTTAKTKVTNAAIQGLTAPITDAAAVTTITSTDEYTGTVAWNPIPENNQFAVCTAYTATITITPKTGYTLTGLSANFFSAAGATSVSNAANSGTVTVVFPATTVSTAAQFETALANNTVATIILSETITGNVTATRTGATNFTIDFGTYSLVGSLNLVADMVTAITFNGTAIPAITGNLTLSATLATVTNNISVGGTITINGVGDNTWIEVANGNQIIVHDDNGATFDIQGLPEGITVTNGANGINITANIPIDIVINAGAEVDNITVGTDAAGSSITNNGTVTNVTANSDISVANNSGAVNVGGTGTIGTSGTASGNVTGTAVIVTGITDLAIPTVLRIGGTTTATITTATSGSTYNVTSANPLIVSVDAATGLAITALAPGKTAITVQVKNASGDVTHQGTIAVTVLPAEISAAYVTMAAPVLGVTPENAALIQTNTANPDYTVTSVTWNQELTPTGKFKAGVAYTATVVLASKNDKAFQTAAFTPTVATAASVGATTTQGTGSGNSVSFIVTFPATAPLAVTGIEVTTQPSQLQYTAGQLLVLNGMIVTEINNDGTTKTVSFTNGTAPGYTANPANGTALGKTAHSYQTVTITLTASAKTAVTAQLIVVNNTQTAPSGFAAVAPTADSNNGRITGTTSAMEYKLLSSAKDWIAVAGTEITGLLSGTYEVRYAAKEGFDPSPAVQVMVPALVSIAITTPATKTAYKVGEPLNIASLVVTGTYDNLTTKTETITTANISGFNSAAVALSQTLTIKVGYQTTTYTISIAKADGPALVGVTMNDLANTLIGITAGMEFSTNGTTWTAYTAAAPNLPALTGTVALQVRVAATAIREAGAATTFNFTVPTLSSIAITTPATKTAYKVGETLNITGLVVTGTYSDTTTKVETITTGNVTGFNSTAVAASQTLTITVGSRTTTYNISIASAEQAAPTGLSGVSPTTIEGTDGKISGTTSLMEYKLATAADSTYTACSANATTVPAVGNYYVRFAAKTGFNAGAAVLVTVSESIFPRVTAISISVNYSVIAPTSETPTSLTFDLSAIPDSASITALGISFANADSLIVGDTTLSGTTTIGLDLANAGATMTLGEIRAMGHDRYVLIGQVSGTGENPSPITITIIFRAGANQYQLSDLTSLKTLIKTVITDAGRLDAMRQAFSTLTIS